MGDYWADSRAVSYTHLDVYKRQENFFVDAGYSGHGFCLGPASGVACADLILEGKTDLAVSELAFARFDKTR